MIVGLSSLRMSFEAPKLTRKRALGLVAVGAGNGSVGIALPAGRIIQLANVFGFTKSSTPAFAWSTVIGQVEISLNNSDDSTRDTILCGSVASTQATSFTTFRNAHWLGENVLLACLPNDFLVLDADYPGNVLVTPALIELYALWWDLGSTAGSNLVDM